MLQRKLPNSKGEEDNKIIKPHRLDTEEKCFARLHRHHEETNKLSTPDTRKRF